MNYLAAKFGVFVNVKHEKFPTLYWLSELHKVPFIAYSSLCTTTELSKLITS